MAGRTRTIKNKIPQKTYHAVGTQTSPVKDVDKNGEINRLEKKIALLEQQLDRLKVIEERTIIAEKKREEITVVAAADSPQQQKVIGKGCNCKGKCASRVCGCVKKNLACTEFCKCTHNRCKNQEQDKENYPELHPQPRVSSSKPKTDLKPLSPNPIRRIKINPIHEEIQKAVSGPSNKELDQVAESQRSIFSPLTNPSQKNNDVSINLPLLHETLEFPFSPETYGTSNSDSRSPSPIRVNNKKRPTVDYGLKLYNEKISKAVRPKSDEFVKKRLILPHNVTSRHVKAPTESKDDGSPEIRIRRKLIKSEKNNKKIKQESSGNRSGDTESNTTYDKLDDLLIDPMKPTRQLQRTPVRSSSDEIPTRIFEAPSPRPKRMPKEEEVIIPLPKEIDAPHVDWNEHCAQLVPCRHCKRTFYPSRLMKHEASCKKI